MGDLADDFRLMKEVKAKERAEKEPLRFEYAMTRLKETGHRISISSQDVSCLLVDDYIQFWPYTGWYSGKGIGSGRGINNLIKALKESAS